MPGSPGGQLEHQVTGVGGGAQHGQRVADLVVPGRPRRHRRAEALDELGGQVLGGGLAGGPGDPGDLQAGQGVHHGAGQRAQGLRDVGHDQRGRPARPGGQHRGRPGGRGLRGELVPVYPGPGQGREQGTGGGGPGVDDHRAGDQRGRIGLLTRGRPHQLGPGELGDGPEGERDHASSPSRTRAASGPPADLVTTVLVTTGGQHLGDGVRGDFPVVERGHLARGVLPALVTLARYQHDVPFARGRHGQPDRGGPVRLDDHPAAALGRHGQDPLQHLGQDGQRVLRTRVVTGQDGQVGEATAAAPISGRLARSRSPPQPSTIDSRPWVTGRRARSTASTAPGLCE